MSRLGDIVRNRILEATAGTLCTIAAQRGIEGFPFGSVVPNVLDADGRPVFLLAEMATHTANLRRDPRASLLVRQRDDDDDPQAGWRITLIGELERVVREGDRAREGDVVLSADDWAALAARYRARVPASTEYQRTHDFFFWRMREIRKVRYIGGFGAIHWVPPEDVLRDPSLGDAAPGAVAHMNADHRDTIVEMCVGFYGFAPEDAELVGIDRTGFSVATRGPSDLVHFDFGREVGAQDLRHAVIDVLRRARARIAAAS